MTSTISADNIEKLKTIAGVGGWSDDPDRLSAHITEWRGKYHGRTPLMLLPKDTETVSKLIGFCAEKKITVVTQGGNTGLVGGGIPGLEGRSEILLSTQSMSKIENIDAQGYSMTAQAGVPIQILQQIAKEAERLFPLSLASEGSCTLGGTIATNAGGIHVVRYGTMRELVLGLKAVLPDGSIYDNLSPLRKDNTGYNLDQLLAGSEGTLGIITAATVKLFPMERQRVTAWLSLSGLKDCVALFAACRDHWGPYLSAFEIMSADTLNFAQDHIPNCRLPVKGPSNWSALIEIADSGVDSALTKRTTAWLEQLFKTGLVTDGAIAQSEKQRQNFWRIRESLSEAQKLEGISIKHDIALPIDRIPEFHQVTEKALHDRFPGCRVTPFGHLGDGNLHYNVMQPKGSDGASFASCWEEMNELVHSLVQTFNGSISAEHGIGTMKREALRASKAPANLQAMKTIKSALDPHNILNPGVLFTDL